MTFTYKVTAYEKWTGRLTETTPTPDLEAALKAAHALCPGSKVVTVLRADDSGINAGKFFLHQIIK
jgi:hypothetical protein